MSETDINKIKQQLTRVLTTVEPTYIDAVLGLHKRLAPEHVEWALGGELGDALRNVNSTPDCVEIVASKKAATQIFLKFRELSTEGIYIQTHKLDRNAAIEGKEYPVYTRSYYFDFILSGVKIKVHGDLQYRIGNWEWGDKLEFTPEHISVVGVKTAVVPLQVKYEIYQGLGWTDRAEKVKLALTKLSKFASPPQTR
jgi:hypothetical protein